ncbi:MAG: cysteine--tRNA ligase [Patescibacteria group bacterium]
MDIKLYNTLTRAKEDFKPIHEGEVGLYSCGPTVYQYAHIGNMRSYVFSDILKRVLEYNGFLVKQVINITDVGHLVGDLDEGEDKVEQSAAKEDKTAKEIADFYLTSYRDDLVKMNIKIVGTIFPKATEHIQEQINLIKILEEKGFTYRTSDGIYFDTSLYPKYTELAQLDLAGLKEGARVKVNPEKKNPTDFALWKFSQPEEHRQQEWNSSWGIGWPGWHVECSAMSMKYLGSHFDIHTGGIDHIPVHHTNERAQSECATGEPVVNYWLHNGFIMVEGEKMAKSLGNFYRLADLAAKGFTPLAYRYWLLTANYRQTVNFTWEALGAAQTAYKKLINQLSEIKSDTEIGSVSASYNEQFLSFIDDDLNTAGGIALLWDMFKDKNLSDEDKLATTFKWDEVLGLKLRESLVPIEVPGSVRKLVDEREEARQNKDYTKSDELREEIRGLGYSVEDTDRGPKIRRN